MLTHIEPDDVTSNDHTHTLYQVTNDVNESSTDIDVLFRAMFLGMFPPPPPKPLPELLLLATPILRPFLLIPYLFITTSLIRVTVVSSTTLLCMTMSMTVGMEHHTHAVCKCECGPGRERGREGERERERERESHKIADCKICSTYNTFTKTPTQAVINMMSALISIGWITLCTAS